MAGIKISALPSVVAPALTDVLPEVQPAVGGVTYKVTLQQIQTLFASSGGSGLTWSEVTGTTQVITAGNGYVVNNGAGVAFSLPATMAQFGVFAIVGKAGVWSITQGAGQTINVGTTATTPGAGGSLTAASATDSCMFICITANTDYQVIGAPQTVGFVLV